LYKAIKPYKSYGVYNLDNVDYIIVRSHQKQVSLTCPKCGTGKLIKFDLLNPASSHECICPCEYFKYDAVRDLVYISNISEPGGYWIDRLREAEERQRNMETGLAKLTSDEKKALGLI